MEYYSALKTNEITKLSRKWIDLEYVIVSKATSVRKRNITRPLSYVEPCLNMYTRSHRDVHVGSTTRSREKKEYEIAGWG